LPAGAKSPAGLPSKSVGDVEDKAAFLAWAKSPAGSPSESVGARRPQRQNRKRWRSALQVLSALLLGTWIGLEVWDANSAWATFLFSLFIVSFCILYAVALVRMLARLRLRPSRLAVLPV
jgi:hypothetical protein